MRYKLKIRLFSNIPLQASAIVNLEDKQRHYLLNVMRCSAGDILCCFDNQNGEFTCKIITLDKKIAQIQVIEKTKDFAENTDLWLLFAPVKRENCDLIIEKATELGVGKIIPVITEQTTNKNLNLEHLKLKAVEAAEQCGRVNLPELSDAVLFADLIKNWPQNRPLFVMNESGGQDLADILLAQKTSQAGILVGPEGGFSVAEQQILQKLPYIQNLNMGSLILRAETAVIAAISCWQALCGNWRKKP